MDINLFPMSSGVSERASEQTNERSGVRERAKRLVRSKQMSERCKRRSKERSNWPTSLLVDFIVILPTVPRFRKRREKVDFILLLIRLRLY